MNKSIHSFLLLFPIFFIIIFIATAGILNGFFEQDDWLSIANVMNSYSDPWKMYIPWVHFTPLAVFLWSTMYHVFKLHAEYYYLTGLIVHTACSCLVFILTQRLTKNKTVAFLAGLIFLLNGRAHQAFTHPAIFHSTTAGVFFVLLFFVYLSGCREKIFRLGQICVVFLIALAAVSIREEGFILVPTFGMYLLCFDRDKINKKNIRSFAILTAGLILFLFVRFTAESMYSPPVPTQYQIGTHRALYNFATIPIKLVIQNLINYQDIAIFFLKFHHKIYPGMVKNIYLDAAPLMDAAFFYIFSIIAAVSGIWAWAVHPKKIGWFVLFFVAFIGAQAFMLSFVGFPLFVLEPRYLYFSAFPVFCLLAIFLYSVFSSESKFLIANMAKKIFVVVLLAILLSTSYQQIRAAVNNEMKLANAKKKVLASLIQVHPKLADNTIFYVKCKTRCIRNAELGIPNENVLPFPSGPGLNILVTYASRQGQEKEWGRFMTGEWLFHTFSEGYKKIGDRSYGYFKTKSKLEKTLSKNKLSKDVVVVLEYNEENYTLKDISKAFRKTISDK